MSSSKNPAPHWSDGIPRSARLPVLFGFAVVGFTVLGFGAWSATAPIAGAIIASGAFVATGQNKIVQHLEGGVIREILVREGDVVEPGQPLVQLDDTAPRAELRRLTLRLARLEAMEARLQAEGREEASVTFPEHLAKAGDPDIVALLQGQRLALAARRNNVQSEIAVLRDGISALDEKIRGAQVQLASVNVQLGLFEEELEGKTTLLRTGLIRKSEVLALQRSRTNMQGEVGRLMGDMGDARERISRAREQIVGVRNAAIKAAVEQLHETHAELNDVRERMRAARGVLDRVVITAPVRGAVVKLRYHTSGGVIEGGKNIMEILPLSEELLIEVRVQARDIAHVKRGQRAVVRLTALNQRVTPMIPAEVIYVSADALPDERAERTSRDNYVVRVRIDTSKAAEVRAFEPTPGMPAEVYIQTLERTFLQYLMQPIRDSMSRSFRES